MGLIAPENERDMTTSCSLPALYSGGHKLDEGDSALGILKASCDAHTDRELLQGHLAVDGYLFLRGALKREEVLAARRHILTQLEVEGSLDPSAPLMEGKPKPGVKLQFRADLAEKSNHALQHLLYQPQGNLMQFFSSFLGGEVRHFDYTWLRCVSPGPSTPSHCDIVYMGRGTRKLYTAWVPLGDADFELGGLMILEGSHKNERLQKTYGRRDVDLYCSNRPDDGARTAYGSNGAFSENANKVRHSLGGRWLTAEYSAGDVVIFGMDLVHGGSDNQSNRLRISSDSRYQLASEPVDERWVGEKPLGHGSAGKRGRVC
jgi:hypothetical protein